MNRYLDPNQFQPALEGLFDSLVGELEKTYQGLAKELAGYKEAAVEEVRGHLGEESIIIEDEQTMAMQHYLVTQLFIKGVGNCCPEKKQALEQGAALLLHPRAEPLTVPELIERYKPQLEAIFQQKQSKEAKEPTKEPGVQKEKEAGLIDNLVNALLGGKKDHSPQAENPVLGFNRRVLALSVSAGLLPKLPQTTQESVVEQNNRATHGGISTAILGARADERLAQNAVVQNAQFGPLFVQPTTESFMGAEQKTLEEAAGISAADPEGYATVNLIDEASQGVSLEPYFRPSPTPFHVHNKPEPPLAGG